MYDMALPSNNIALLNPRGVFSSIQLTGMSGVEQVREMNGNPRFIFSKSNTEDDTLSDQNSKQIIFLGEGYNSLVLGAKDTLSGNTDVAVKICIDPGILSGDEYQITGAWHNFELEAELLNTLDHQLFPKCIDFTSTIIEVPDQEGTRFVRVPVIVMENRGKSILERGKENMKLDFDGIKIVFSEIARALDYLHFDSTLLARNNGLVTIHGDLKIGNICFHDSGYGKEPENRESIGLVDWGNSNAVRKISHSTQGYASPELFKLIFLQEEIVAKYDPRIFNNSRLRALVKDKFSNYDLVSIDNFALLSSICAALTGYSFYFDNFDGSFIDNIDQEDFQSLSFIKDSKQAKNMEKLFKRYLNPRNGLYRANLYCKEGGCGIMISDFLTQMEDILTGGIGQSVYIGFLGRLVRKLH